MSLLTWKNASLSLLIILLSIILIISRIFYMRYNDENLTNHVLSAIPRYEWREYIDYLKDEIEVKNALNNLLYISYYLQ